MSVERLLLEALAKAADDLLSLAGPNTLPEFQGIPDEWGFPIPLRWELLARSLWMSDVDAFDLAAGVLPRRASPAVLAPIRLLWENYVLVRWLVESGKARRGRSMDLVFSEIHDLRSQAEIMTTQPKGRDGLLRMADAMEEELTKRASAEGHDLALRPSNAELRKQYGGSRFAYRSLSDIGVHAGLVAPLAFFNSPGEKRIKINFIQGGIAQRTYYLSMALELHVVTSYNLARSSGWPDLPERLAALHDSQGDNIAAASKIIRELGEPRQG